MLYTGLANSMMIVISPAKKLATHLAPHGAGGGLACTLPDFLPLSEQLVKQLCQLSLQQLQQFMSLSKSLAALNYQRYRDWQLPFTTDNATPAVLLFQGDVYAGLQAGQWPAAQYERAQGYLRILSGLYGLLRPLDLIQPYRLEMGRPLAVGNCANLYDFWQQVLVAALNRQLQEKACAFLLNLASVEYAKAIHTKQLAATMITPKFKQWQNGRYRVISFFAKKARGRLAAWCIRKQVTRPQDLGAFNEDGYRYSEQQSTPSEPIYLRKAV